MHQLPHQPPMNGRQGPPPPQVYGAPAPPLQQQQAPPPPYYQQQQPPPQQYYQPGPPQQPWGQQQQQYPPPPQQYAPPPQQYAPQPQQYGAAPGSGEIRSLWIGDLQYWMDESYLHYRAFAPVAPQIANVKIIRNKQNGQSEGYGFIEFHSQAAAEYTLMNLNGQMMPNVGMAFKLKWASASAGEKRGDNNEDAFFKDYAESHKKLSEPGFAPCSATAAKSDLPQDKFSIEVYKQLQDATEAIEVDTKCPDGYIRRGAALLADGKYYEAMRDFQIVKQICPNDPDATRKLKECVRRFHELELEANSAGDAERHSVGDSIDSGMIGKKYNDLLDKYDRLLAEKNQLLQKYSNLERHHAAACEEKKILSDKLMELTGSIRVICRPRPWIDSENGSSSTIEVDRVRRNKLRLKINETKSIEFKCDHFFLPDDNQGHIFAEILPMVNSFMDGFNVCIFAYGPSGSGKTYTMEGTSENPGIIYRALDNIFVGRLVREYNISLSILEMSKDGPKDLLNPSNKLKAREFEGMLYFPDLTDSPILTMEDASAKLTKARKQRAVGSTNINKESSRSHCLIKVTMRNETKENYLTLIDLAGNERLKKSGAEGDTESETRFINTTLSSLKGVLQALILKSSHIPFRESPFTHLLQHFLGEGSKVVMLTNVSSSPLDVNETRWTLEFVKEVCNIERATAPNLIKSPPPSNKGKKESGSALPNEGRKEPKSAGGPLRSSNHKTSISSPLPISISSPLTTSRALLGRPPRPPDHNRGR